MQWWKVLWYLVECDWLFISLLISVVELGFMIQNLQLEDKMQHMDPGLYLLVSFTGQTCLIQ